MEYISRVICSKCRHEYDVYDVSTRCPICGNDNSKVAYGLMTMSDDIYANTGVNVSTEFIVDQISKASRQSKLDELAAKLKELSSGAKVVE